MIKLIVSAFVMSAVLMGGRSEATVTPNYIYWGMNAAGCVPGDPAIQNNLYFITGGSVKFQSTATGTITLYCPVAVNTGGISSNTLRLTYFDGDSGIGGNHVTATLTRLAYSDGTLSTISGATVDSGNGTCSTGIQTNCAATFTHTFDFDNYAYYVRVDITRSSTSVVETFYATKLETPP